MPYLCGCNCWKNVKDSYTRAVYVSPFDVRSYVCATHQCVVPFVCVCWVELSWVCVPVFCLLLYEFHTHTHNAQARACMRTHTQRRDPWTAIKHFAPLEEINNIGSFVSFSFSHLCSVAMCVFFFFSLRSTRGQPKNETEVCIGNATAALLRSLLCVRGSVYFLFSSK